MATSSSPQVVVKKSARATAPRVKKSVTKKTKVTPKTATKPKVVTTPALPAFALLKGKSTLSPQAKLPLFKRNPLGHLLIEKMLREAGFRGGVSSDQHVLEKYSTDESIFSIRPQVVIQPKNKVDVEIATIVIARETKRFDSLSLTPRAAGTGLGGGSLTDSIVIDVCAHLHHIGEVTVKKDKITFTCEPGAMWRDIEKKLKRHDAYLPPYTASKDICSIGGTVANNGAGPDSLRYGHCADWVESMDVVLSDGKTYTIKPLTYKEFKTLTKAKHRHAELAREVLALIENNETEIKKGRPKTKKNTAGFALWDVVPDGIAAFKRGEGSFDLTRLFSGSQGTLGIITSLTLRALPIAHHTTLLAVPIFELADAAKVIQKSLTYNPINVEMFDALSFDLALKNPDFFKQRLEGLDYYRALLSMYTSYHIRYGRRTPEYTILITLDQATLEAHTASDIIKDISTEKTRARVVTNRHERDMLWLIRRSSYTLSKLQDRGKRPAAFLEDMTVPPEHLAKFLTDIKRLLKEFNVTAAIHGHGGDGHFHFYPLLDFTQKTTPLLVERMSEQFFATALKYKGNICGEHNDGIIRTPHLNKLFNKKMLDLFKATEHLFDPDDIFNPGKKVNPKYDIKTSMRTSN